MIITRRYSSIQFQSLTHWLRQHKQDVYTHPNVQLLKKNIKQDVFNYKHITHNIILPALLIFFISLALSQPYRITHKLPEPPAHRDIIFMLDTSVSMVLKDYVVNGQRIDRITMLQNVLSHFIDRLNGNRMQLIVFSEQAYTLVPLTEDYALLKYQLQRIQPAVLTGRGTDISRALLYAVQPYLNTENKDSIPVVVMLTDANRPVRDIDPVTTARYIAEQGIRLHTIAIGAASYSAEQKRELGLIYHPASFYLLEKIAQAGNGKLFWARNTQLLQDALAEIQKTEKRKTQTQAQYVKQHVYYWPLGFAVLLLGILYTFALFRNSR